MAHLLRRPILCFALHFLESEIKCCGLTCADARCYLDEQHRDYERRLANDNITRNELRRIDQNFAFLYNRYPASARDGLKAKLNEEQNFVARLPASLAAPGGTDACLGARNHPAARAGRLSLRPDQIHLGASRDIHKIANGNCSIRSRSWSVSSENLPIWPKASANSWKP